MKSVFVALLLLVAVACIVEAGKPQMRGLKQAGERVYPAYDDDDVPSVNTGETHRPVYYYPIDDDFADREGTYYRYNYNVYESPSSSASVLAATAGLAAAGVLAFF